MSEDKLKLKPGFLITYQKTEDKIDKVYLDELPYGKIKVKDPKLCKFVCLYTTINYDLHFIDKVIGSASAVAVPLKTFVIGYKLTLKEVEYNDGKDSELYKYLTNNFKSKQFVVFPDVTIIEYDRSWKIISPEELKKNDYYIDYKGDNICQL